MQREEKLEVPEQGTRQADAAYRLAAAYIEGGAGHGERARFDDRDTEVLHRVLDSLSPSDAMVIAAAQDRRRPNVTRAAAVLLAMHLRRAGVAK